MRQCHRCRDQSVATRIDRAGSRLCHLHPRDGRAPEAASIDFVMDAVGAKATRAASFIAVKPGGVIMRVGLQDWASEIDMRKLTLAEITLLGTYTYTTATARRCAHFTTACSARWTGSRSGASQMVHGRLRTSTTGGRQRRRLFCDHRLTRGGSRAECREWIYRVLRKCVTSHRLPGVTINSSLNFVMLSSAGRVTRTRTWVSAPGWRSQRSSISWRRA